MFFKKKYDLIFGIGEACSCSFTLRRGNLQTHSFPFDWLFGSTFAGRVDIISDDFKDFLRLPDLKYTGNNGVPNHLCDIYENTYTGLVFNHDFLSGANLAEKITEVSEKYQRRADRLYKLAGDAGTILVVWIDSPGSLWTKKQDEDFILGQKKLQEKFPNAKVDLLVFEWDKDLSYKNKKYEKLNDNIIKYSFDYQFHHKKKVVADYVVDEKMLMKIISNYELKMTLKEKIDNYFFKKRKK